jgi:4-hydroxybenzoate polyprenyltransferase
MVEQGPIQDQQQWALAKALKYVREMMDMIKFEHTAFALPFAFIGALAATQGRVPWPKYFWVLAAMVGARTLAMTYNRMADVDLDAENPRTSARALPAGRVKPWMAWLAIGLSAILFGLAAAMLGPLPAKLAPYAFAVLLGYSLAKRFTAWSHAILGLTLSCAPLGAWIAITGQIEAPALWLSLGVLAWTTGFDILYSLQDRDFDIKKGLHSIPAELGVTPALVISKIFHALAIAAWAMFLLGMDATLLPWLSLAIVVGMLYWEHQIVKGGDLSRIGLAFFKLNSLVGVVLFLGYLAHWMMMRGTV